MIIPAELSQIELPTSRYRMRRMVVRNSNIYDEIKLETTVRTYGAAFLSSPDENELYP